MTYDLDQISSVLHAIATELALEGITHSPSYAEEITAVASRLRQLPPVDPKDFVTFTAIIAVHAVIFGICAAESRQQGIDRRPAKHAERAETMRALTTPKPTKLN
jgi:hypothetical protein